MRHYYLPSKRTNNNRKRPYIFVKVRSFFVEGVIVLCYNYNEIKSRSLNQKGRCFMASLYELTGDYLAMLQKMQDADLDDETIAQVLEDTGINDEINQKAEGYCYVIKNLEHNVNVIADEMKRLDEEKKRLDSRITVFENRINRMKEALKKSMELTGKKKIVTELFTIGIQKNGGKRIMDVTTPVYELPEEFRVKQPDKVNKDAVREYIMENGIENEQGDLVSDYGIIYHQNEILRIK